MMFTPMTDVPTSSRRYDLMKRGQLRSLPPRPESLTATMLILMASLLKEAVIDVGKLEQKREDTEWWRDAYSQALTKVLDRETEIRVALFTAHAPVEIGDRT